MLLLRIFWYTLDQSVFPFITLKRVARQDLPLKNSETLTPDCFGVYTAWFKRAAILEVSC